MRDVREYKTSMGTRCRKLRLRTPTPPDLTENALLADGGPARFQVDPRQTGHNEAGQVLSRWRVTRPKVALYVLYGETRKVAP